MGNVLVAIIVLILAVIFFQQFFAGNYFNRFNEKTEENIKNRFKPIQIKLNTNTPNTKQPEEGQDGEGQEDNAQETSTE